jgi:predicted nucleic acid-binding Zn ribbon protein
MPVYVYRRPDGSTFELEQRITAVALARCPTTGHSVERVLQPFSAHYKGTGFYSTDHAKAGRAKPSPPAGATNLDARPSDSA